MNIAYIFSFPRMAYLSTGISLFLKFFISIILMNSDQIIMAAPKTIVETQYTYFVSARFSDSYFGIS